MAFPRIPARFHACVLAASLAFAGCSTTDAVDFLLDEAAEPADEGPRVEEAYGSYGEEPPAAPPSEEVTRVTLGAWGFDGRVQGHASGAPSEHGMDAKVIPGFSVEARVHSKAEGAGNWSTFGILLENFHDEEDKGVAGGIARTQGSLTAAWFLAGVAGNPQFNSRDVPVDFDYRLDLMIGLRRGAVEASVPNPAGGTYRQSSVWGEVAVGLRGEWSPCRRVFLFTRGDVGSEGNSRSSSEDETGGDAVVGSVSSQFMAGIRVRPVEHVSLVAGWRYVRLAGKEFVDHGTADVPTARAVWSGPWAGLEVDF